MQSAVLIFLLSLVTMASSSTHCRHNITADENIWNCSDTFTLDFPKTDSIPDGVQVYDLSFNRILELHRINSTCTSVHSCKGCLRKLYLHHNSIDQIENEAFQKLHCLHTLDLSYNKITGGSLSYMTFDGLLQLEFLSLKGNPLKKLTDFTLRFNELRMLNKLDLSDCQLTSVAEHAFDDISLLEEIDLSGNSLKIIDPYSFEGLSFLDLLDLSRNSFETIQEDNFIALIKLRELRLDGNKLETLPAKALGGLGNLETLSLSENWLKGIPYHTIKDLRYLKILNMSRNHVIELEASDWPEDVTSRLTELYLDQMYGLSIIKHKAFVSFPLLRKVSISGNKQLEVIAYDAFLGNTHQIKEVYLRDNNLGFIAGGLLPWDSLEVLELDGNPWNCDCRFRWVLQGGYLKNNTIRCDAPDKLRGQNLLGISPEDLRCPRSLIWILLTFVICIVLLLIVLVSLVAWRFRHKLPCRRTKGRYVSVYSKDVQDDDEGTATITSAEDEVPLKDSEV
ncbi:leucine-rich repeat neuronal protein 1-like [Haliotis asinina]|uniref:leucine-rich repeat neuronal protein 1-like n=1 Tax=Haliotis asinina TaxID=109174 RepID=UPI003531BA98